MKNEVKVVKTPSLLLTAAGHHQLQKELSVLQKVRLKEIMQKMIAALESEHALLGNTAYEQALAEKEMLDFRIAEIEDILHKARVVKAKRLDRVGVGATITLRVEGELESYTLVSSVEVDARSGRISYESPLGAALLGKAENEPVVVSVPSGKLVYQVVKIDYLNSAI